MKLICQSLFCLFINLCFISCKENIDTKTYNKRNYVSDDFMVFDFKSREYADYAYINVSNDTVYLLENYGNDCNMVWTLGYLGTNHEKTLSLNNNCNSSSIIDHLYSLTESMDKSDKNFMFNIDIGNNGNLNVRDSKRIILYSRDKGILYLIKADTLGLPPFY